MPFCVVLEEDGFGAKPFFYSFVAEDGHQGERHPGGEGEARLIGYVLYFFTYDTWCRLLPMIGLKSWIFYVLNIKKYFFVKWSKFLVKSSYTISEKESRSVHMEGIYVSPDHRGRGLGKLLWQACVKVESFLMTSFNYKDSIALQFTKFVYLTIDIIYILFCFR